MTVGDSGITGQPGSHNVGPSAWTPNVVFFIHGKKQTWVLVQPLWRPGIEYTELLTDWLTALVYCP